MKNPGNKTKGLEMLPGNKEWQNDWHKWFAWRPVRVYLAGEDRHKVKLVWLHYVERKRAYGDPHRWIYNLAVQKKEEKMKLTQYEIELLNGMIKIQKNHAERCKQLKGSIPKKQRKKDLERAELLERIKKELLKKEEFYESR